MADSVGIAFEDYETDTKERLVGRGGRLRPVSGKIKVGKQRAGTMKFKRNETSGAVAFELQPGENQLPVEPAYPGATPLPIFHIKKILVPVDFSKRSQKAVAYATALARQFDAGVTLVHVVPHLHNSPELVSLALDDSAIEQSRKKLEATSLKVRTVCRCDAIVVSGMPAQEIASLAAKQGSDLIIVATRGRTGFARVIHKSMAEHVIRAAPCPVLVVKEKEHEFLVSEEM